jgi:hypothetical protein
MRSTKNSRPQIKHTVLSLALRLAIDRWVKILDRSPLRDYANTLSFAEIVLKYY